MWTWAANLCACQFYTWFFRQSYFTLCPRKQITLLCPPEYELFFFFLTQSCTENVASGSPRLVQKVFCYILPGWAWSFISRPWGHKNSSSRGFSNDFQVNAAFRVLLPSLGFCFNSFGFFRFIWFCFLFTSEDLHFLRRSFTAFKHIF